MDVVTLDRACINCGRLSHHIVHDGDGVGLCASARLPGYEPRGCAKWRATDDLGGLVVRYVRAWRNKSAVARELGPWRFVAPDGRRLPDDPPLDVRQEAIRLRTSEE